MTIAIATIIRRHNTTYKKVELLLCRFILLLLLFLYFPDDHPSLLLIFKVTHTFIQQYYYIFNMAVRRKARINEWTMNYRSGGRGCWLLWYMECPCLLIPSTTRPAIISSHILARVVLDQNATHLYFNHRWRSRRTKEKSNHLVENTKTQEGNEWL